MSEAYQTLIVKFNEPITTLDGMFDDAEAWGVSTLKGWIDNYESSVSPLLTATRQSSRASTTWSV